MTARDEHDELSRRAEELQRVLEIHPADFDLQTRGRAFEEALMVRGHGELAAAIRVLVELLTGRLPCGHEPSGPPVDGRDVDRVPEDTCGCLTGPQHTRDDHRALTPQTGGGSVAPPTAGPSSPHATKES